MAWTTADLLTAVRRDCRIPDGAHPIPDADILATADEQLLLVLVPLLHETDQNYLVETRDVTVVAGTKNYRIFERAAAGGIRDVWLVTNGIEQQLSAVDPEDLWRFSWSSTPRYAIEGDEIVVPTPPTPVTATLRVRYYFRPSKLVTVAECASITDANPGTGTGHVVVSLETPIVNRTVDVVQARPQFAPLLVEGYAEGSPVPANEIILQNSALAAIDVAAAGMVIGDFVCRASESCVPQVPDVLHMALRKLTAANVAIATGQMPRAMALQGEAERELARVSPMLAKRNTGNIPRIVNRNSPLRQGRRWRGYR